MSRAPWSLLLLAAALRALVCMRTVVPGRDGVTYLWMAERAAHGELDALFATVFHPLYPALVAVALRLLPWADPVAVGQAVAAGLGALALLPLWALTRDRFGARGAFWCGIAYATGSWFARHPAECMSEGPFYLLVATWAHALLGERPRPWRAGVCAALAYLARPEGMALIALGCGWLVLRGARRDAVRLLAAALPIAALLPLGYAMCGHGFTLTPKAAFNYEVGVGSAAAPVWHYVSEALALPLAAAEEFGFVWLPLLVAGVVRARPRRLAEPTALLLAPLFAQCAIVPLLHSHWRFLSGFGVLLLPFAAASVPPLLDAARRWRPWAVPLLLALLFGSEVRVLELRDAAGAAERELGRWLRARLAPGEIVVSDAPRIVYFAGNQPPPPRPILPADILRAAADPACRYVVLIERASGPDDPSPRRRTAVDLARLQQLGLEPLSSDGLLSPTVAESGAKVYAKSRPR